MRQLEEKRLEFEKEKLEVEKLKLQIEQKNQEEILKQKQKQHEETLVSKRESEKKKLMQSLLTKMQPLKDNERVEIYLEQFERWAKTQSIPKTDWPVYIHTLLTGKAKEALMRLKIEDTKDYEMIKTAVLDRHNLTPEEYRRKFRASRKSESESYTEWVLRMELESKRWFKSRNVTTLVELQELIVEKQFLRNTYA